MIARPQANRTNPKPHAGHSDKKRKSTALKHGTNKDPLDQFNDKERHEMVATCAYYRAQDRNFDNGSAEQDWYEAEALLRERFSSTDVEKIASSRGEATNIETKGEQDE